MKETLIRACKLAGAFQIEQLNKPLEAKVKESISSVVTYVDISSEKLIIDTIKDQFPSHNILSEECGFEDLQSKFTWIIDPLDGTSNYSAGLPWFGVLIALLEEGQPLMGAAYLPVEDKMFFAERDKGAFLNGRKIEIETKELSDSLFSFSTDYSSDDTYISRGIEMYKFIIQHSRNVRTTNSLVDFVNVADSKFGGCINLFTRIWDIVAPSLIIEEAGGLFTTLDGNPLEFEINSSIVDKNFGILTGNKLAYRTVFESFV